MKTKTKNNSVPSKKISHGFSLIELMVAVLIGIIMLSALVSLFTNFSNMNRAQNGLARIQENGRFISLNMKQDIENVGFQPCATISMDSPQRIDKGFATRPFISFSTLSNGFPNAIAGEKAAVIDTQYLIQGHECTGSTCTPAIKVFPGGDISGKIPDAGTTAGSRAQNTDVLTVRFIKSNSATINDDTLNGGFTSTIGSINLATNPANAPLNLEDGNDILISNCFNTVIAKAKLGSGNKIKVPIATLKPEATVAWATSDNLTSVFNFTKDFVTVSYYIGLKTNPDNDKYLISSLYRVENGNAPQEIVEGVERFDLTYGVKFSDGKVGYLTAKDIQDNTDATKCIVAPITPASITGLTKLANGTGCLWRSVFAIKVNVLLNTVYNSAQINTEPYTYSIDTTLNPQTPTNPTSGVNGGYMYRKEFTTTISLQSNNL